MAATQLNVQMWALGRSGTSSKAPEKEQLECKCMTLMKVCVSLPPLSFIVYRIRGRTDTPVGVGTKEVQLECRSLSFIITLPCGLHTIFSLPQSLHLNNLFLPRLFLSSFTSISILAAFLTLLTFLFVFETISFSFVLFVPHPFSLFSLSSSASHPLPHLPSSWLAVFCRGVWILSDTADRSTSITPGSLTNKTSRHPGRRPPLEFATPKPAHTLALAKGGEVKKEHRARWAADLYAFIRAWPWSWMPLRELDGSLHPQTHSMWAHWLHIEVHMYRQKAAETWQKRILCTYRTSELHL